MTYKSVRDLAATLCGLDIDNLLTVDRNRIDQGLRHYLQRLWESHWWPELMTIERRQFAADWASGTTYSAGTFCYYPPADKYFQAVAPSGNLNQAPASGTDYETVNYEYWAEAVGLPDGADWEASTGYVQGDKVIAPTDGEVYICRVDETSGTTWSSTNWGRLYTFVRRVLTTETSYTTLGEVKAVWNTDPRGTETAYELAFMVDATGIIVAGDECRVYVENRIRCPEYTGAEYVGGTSYTAGDSVYYAAGGDYYTCIQSHSTPAKSPATETAYWTKNEFPYIFRQAAAQGAYVDWLRIRGQTEKVAAEDSKVWELLGTEIEKLDRQQNQNRQMKVVTR